MSNAVHNFKTFEPKGSHSFLIDCNVLVYLFTAIGQQQLDKQKTIGKFFADSNRVNSTLYVTSHILSEFYHVNLDIYFDQWVVSQATNKKYSIKKDYRPTQTYLDSVNSINHQVGGIIGMTQKLKDGFDTVDVVEIQKMLNSCEFNDALILDIANRNNLILVTNDADLVAHPQRTCQVLTF